jgi:hypothetical protein
VARRKNKPGLLDRRQVPSSHPGRAKGWAHPDCSWTPKKSLRSPDDIKGLSGITIRAIALEVDGWISVSNIGRAGGRAVGA